MSDQTMETLRSLLEASERERTALRQTLADALQFQSLAETVGNSPDLETLGAVLASTLGRVVPWVAATVRIGVGNCPSREVFAQGMGPRVVERFRELEEEALVRWAMESQRPTAIPSLDGPVGRGWIIVPLVVQNRTVGLAGLIPALPGEQVAVHQMDMLRLIAAQAAAAMDNLGHMEDVRRNWGELHSLYEVASTLGKSLEIEHLFQTANRSIGERYAPKIVAMGFPEPAGGAIRIFAAGADPDACAAMLALGMEVDRLLVLGLDLSHGRELAELGVSCALVIPLFANERHLGSLLVAHDSTEFVDSWAAREWFQTVGRLLSSSLENASLYEELMVSTRRMSEMQTRMVQAGRLAGIGQLAGGIAHEINNPLQVILGRVQILQVRCEGQPVLLTDLGRLETETMRIAQIVRGMQEFARQQGESSERQVVPISVIVESVLELVAFRTRRHRIDVVRKGFQDSPIVMCDVDELKHLVLNLCLNSIQAMTGGGTLSVAVARREGRAVLEVEDTGSGIPPEDLDRIFDPFFARRPEGMGMGLAICYAIAQRHAGSLYAVAGLPEGALLRLELPLHEPANKTESVIRLG